MKSRVFISLVITALFGNSTAFAVPNWMRVPRTVTALSNPTDDTPSTISHPNTVPVNHHAVDATLSAKATSPDTKRSPETPTRKDNGINIWGGFARREDASSDTNTRSTENPTSDGDGRHQAIYRRGVAGNPGAIIGIVFGCLDFIGLVWFGVCYCNGTVVD